MAPLSWPLQARSQAIRELEFHISPACSSSRPQCRGSDAGLRQVRDRPGGRVDQSHGHRPAPGRSGTAGL